MNEEEATIKALRSLGGHRNYATGIDLWWWEIPSINGYALITQVEDKFVLGHMPNASREQILNRSTGGYRMLEKLADNFPELAKKLAEPIDG